MAAMFLAGAALIGRSSAEADPRVQRRSRIAVGVGVVGAAGAWWGAFVGIDEMAEGAGLVRLGANGRLLHVVMLLGLVLALAQLESVLRASRDPFRFRIKFVILGLCALAGFEVYVTSQTLLLGAWRVHHAALSGIATLVSVGLDGLRDRAHAPRAHARPRFGLVAGALRVVHAAGRGTLPARSGAARRSAPALGAHLERGRERARGVRRDARARGGGLLAGRALALPRRGVAAPAPLALRLPHEVAGGDGRLSGGRVGRAGARSAARRAGAHVRDAAAVDLPALRGGRPLPPGALAQHRGAAAADRGEPPGGCDARTRRRAERSSTAPRAIRSCWRRGPCSACRCGAPASSSAS